MKKIKSYTLIEVVIASFIFMVVSVMATVSFGMIRSSNEKAATLKNAGECREILQNYLKSEVKSSNDGERIMGVQKTSGYFLKRITSLDVLTDPTAANQFVGVALFQVGGKYKVIFKDLDDINHVYHYYFVDGLITPDVLPDSLDITSQLEARKELLKSGEISCVASDPASDPASTQTPFTIISVKQNGSDTATAPHTFKISLSDKIFTQYGTAIPTALDKNFAVTQVEVINSDSGI